MIVVVAASLVVASNSQAQATYDGRETPAGTGWRATADAMIDQNRKADVNVRVELADGTPVEGATVHVEMLRHTFRFGSAVDARYLDASHAEYNPAYGAKIEELFNTGGFFNNLKWRAWAGDFGPNLEPDVTQAGIDWFAAHDMPVRGHTILWPRYQSVSDSVRAILDIPSPTTQDKQALYDATFAHIADIATAMEGQVFAWDILNEPRSSNDIEQMLVGFTPAGEPTITSWGDLRARWFTAAKAASPTATMMINDFQIFPGGGLADTQPADYQAQIDAILAAGGPVEGIGYQSHFSDLPEDQGRKNPLPPADVWAVLDDFQTKYDLPAHITEYDFESTDLDLQGDYMRDFMTAVFAHESVEAFVMWGFWEGDIGKPSAALYDTNWNIKPNGQAYNDLVFDEWWTDELGSTSAAGDIATRAFMGDYRITVDYNGETHVLNEVLESSGLDRTVVFSGGSSTQFNGGDLLEPANWSFGLPTLATPGTIAVSGTSSERAETMDVVQTAGTIDFTNAQAFRSGFENATWRLEGGVVTDSNSGIRLHGSDVFVAGGSILLGPNFNINLARGTSLLEVTAGEVNAQNIQFGTIANATTGAKVLQIGGTGTLALADTQPLKYGDDGDTQNDHLNILTGWSGSINSLASSNYYKTLWEDGRLLLNEQTSSDLSLTFAEAGFLVFDNGDGWSQLRLTPTPGDFNFDGTVNQADYGAWRDGLGGTYSAEHYAIWKSRFGLDSTSSVAEASTAAVPEPSGWWLAACGVGFVVRLRSPHDRGKHRQGGS